MDSYDHPGPPAWWSRSRPAPGADAAAAAALAASRAAPASIWSMATMRMTKMRAITRTRALTSRAAATRPQSGTNSSNRHRHPRPHRLSHLRPHHLRVAFAASRAGRRSMLSLPRHRLRRRRDLARVWACAELPITLQTASPLAAAAVAVAVRNINSSSCRVLRDRSLPRSGGRVAPSTMQPCCVRPRPLCLRYEGDNKPNNKAIMSGQIDVYFVWEESGFSFVYLKHV